MKDQKPVHEIRLGGVRAAIWRNALDDGRVRHTVSFSRLYKEEGAWRDATSFRRRDLPLVAKVADMAHTWIYQHATEYPETNGKSENPLPGMEGGEGRNTPCSSRVDSPPVRAVEA